MVKSGYVFAGVCVLLAALVSEINITYAGTLVLGENGKTGYQLVIPDDSQDKILSEALYQTARLFQAPFKENGIEIQIVKESEKVADKNSIFLGNTDFARKNRIDTSTIEDWSYYFKVTGKDIIIAGHDHAPPKITDPELTGKRRYGFAYRLGTLKAVTDFLREYAGTFFLYPGNNIVPTNKSSNVAEWSLYNTSNIEYKKMAKIEVPDNLNIFKKVFLRVYSTRGSSFYHIANNYLPKVDDAILGHSHNLAVDPEKYLKDHPEYYALNGKTRIKPENYAHVQLCYSNPEVVEILYQFHKKWLDMGFRTVNILQPDGFRGCQCEKCRKLYGCEEKDWAEKLWILHDSLARRLYKAHPDKKVLLTAYALAQNPPKTIKKFSPNVIIQNVDAVCEDTDTFRMWHKVHKGEYSAWSHNWIQNFTPRVVPMRTPLFLERQAKWYYKRNNRGIFRDGSCLLYGLDGASYYIFGRMFDDPENLKASDLMFEYCSAAFGDAGGIMRRFYDRLYHSIELYSLYLGTHGVGWTYNDIYGRRHKHINDPFGFLAFLFPPKLLKEMEEDLTQAERKTSDEKIKTRLILVRREFDYLVSMMKVVELYNAFEASPSVELREILCDAIDERNAMINEYYVPGSGRRSRQKVLPGWDRGLFPPPGYYLFHMKLDFNSYQHPFKGTVFGWDTEAVRKSPLPGTQVTMVQKVDKEPELFSEIWSKIKSTSLQGLPVNITPEKNSSYKMAYDSDNLYIRVECSMDKDMDASTFPVLTEKDDFSKNESIDFYIAPIPGEEMYYRFMVGPNESTRYDAANGLIKDKLNLLYGRDDKSWSGDWKYISKFATNKPWRCMLIIPFRTLGAKAPAEGETWKANIARNHLNNDGTIEASIWSANGATRSIAERQYFGTLEFKGATGDSGASENKLTKWRTEYYKKTFDVPEDWKKMTNKLPQKLGPWKFSFDQLENGMKEKWFDVKFDDSKWGTIKVPSFWAENECGNFTGYGWYRTKLNIPVKWKGKTVKIMFGSADEQAWVYFNGKLVREHSSESENIDGAQMWEMPFTAEIKPDEINYGGENLLTVRVLNMRANGGLWRDVMVCVE